jgi:hypothetical protein
MGWRRTTRALPWTNGASGARLLVERISGAVEDEAAICDWRIVRALASDDASFLLATAARDASDGETSSR